MRPIFYFSFAPVNKRLAMQSIAILSIFTILLPGALLSKPEESPMLKSESGKLSPLALSLRTAPAVRSLTQPRRSGDSLKKGDPARIIGADLAWQVRNSEPVVILHSSSGTSRRQLLDMLLLDDDPDALCADFKRGTSYEQDSDGEPLSLASSEIVAMYRNQGAIARKPKDQLELPFEGEDE